MHMCIYPSICLPVRLCNIRIFIMHTVHTYIYTYDICASATVGTNKKGVEVRSLLTGSCRWSLATVVISWSFFLWRAAGAELWPPTIPVSGGTIASIKCRNMIVWIARTCIFLGATSAEPSKRDALLLRLKDAYYWDESTIIVARITQSFRSSSMLIPMAWEHQQSCWLGRPWLKCWVRSWSIKLANSWNDAGTVMVHSPSGFVIPNFEYLHF